MSDERRTTWPTCGTCGGAREVCLRTEHGRDGAWVKTWVSTNHCPTGGTGAPHRHNLVPCVACSTDQPTDDVCPHGYFITDGACYECCPFGDGSGDAPDCGHDDCPEHSAADQPLRDAK